jgi:hypothetical protein
MRESYTPLYLDPFLALPKGMSQRPWVCDQWLSDSILSLAYSISGFEGLNLLVAALFTTTFFVLLYSELTSKGSETIPNLSPIAASIACLIAFKLAQVHFILRPVVFSFLLFLPVWRASRTLARTGALSFSFSIGLPLLFALWANIHPSFFLGLIWLCIGFSCAILAGRSKILSPTLAIIAASGACTLCNPYGGTLHWSIFELTQSDYFMKLHEEWLPPDYNSSEGSFFLATLIFLGVGTGITLLRKELRSHLTLFDVISCGIALILTLRSIRTLPVWGIVSAPLLTLSFCGVGTSLIQLLRAPRSVAKGWENIERRERPGRGITQASLLATILVIMSFFPSTFLKRGVDPSIAGAGYPVAIIEKLRRAVEKEGKKAILFAHPSYGGAITFYGYPAVKAVIDDRNTLLGEQFYKKFFAAREKRELFETFAQELGVTHVLLSRDEVNEFRIHEWSRTTLLAEDSSNILYALN